MSNSAIVNVKIYGYSFSHGKGYRRKLSNRNNAKQLTNIFFFNWNFIANQNSADFKMLISILKYTEGMAEKN